jgi:hypothetical protein
MNDRPNMDERAMTDFGMEGEAEERLLADTGPLEDPEEVEGVEGETPPEEIEFHDHGEPEAWQEGDETDDGPDPHGMSKEPESGPTPSDGPVYEGGQS